MNDSILSFTQLLVQCVTRRKGFLLFVRVFYNDGRSWVGDLLFRNLGKRVIATSSKIQDVSRKSRITMILTEVIDFDDIQPIWLLDNEKGTKSAGKTE